MANEQPYLEIEGKLHWVASENDGTGHTTYTYLMDHVPGEIKITSPFPLDTDTKKRIIKLETMDLKRPLAIKELLGTRYEVGDFHAQGIVVDTIPENGVDVRQFIAANNTPAEIDRTFGRGTVWEQLAVLNPEDYEDPLDFYEYSDGYPNSDDDEIDNE